jgi:hypothetical protein
MCIAGGFTLTVRPAPPLEHRATGTGLGDAPAGSEGDGPGALRVGMGGRAETGAVEEAADLGGTPSSEEERDPLLAGAEASGGSPGSARQRRRRRRGPPRPEAHVDTHAAAVSPRRPGLGLESEALLCGSGSEEGAGGRASEPASESMAGAVLGGPPSPAARSPFASPPGREASARASRPVAQPHGPALAAHPAGHSPQARSSGPAGDVAGPPTKPTAAAGLPAPRPADADAAASAPGPAADLCAGPAAHPPPLLAVPQDDSEEAQAVAAFFSQLFPDSFQRLVPVCNHRVRWAGVAKSRLRKGFSRAAAADGHSGKGHTRLGDGYGQLHAKPAGAKPSQAKPAGAKPGLPGETRARAVLSWRPRRQWTSC